MGKDLERKKEKGAELNPELLQCLEIGRSFQRKKIDMVTVKQTNKQNISDSFL